MKTIVKHGFSVKYPVCSLSLSGNPRADCCAIKFQILQLFSIFSYLLGQNHINQVNVHRYKRSNG